MAEYGLKIKNASGYLVIDGTYSNMALSSSGVLSFASAEQLINGAYIVNLNISGVSPSIALRTTAGASVLNAIKTGPNSFLFQIISTTRDSVAYYVFDNVVMAPRYNTPYGLIVKNKNTGQVVFDSRCPYMRVIGVIAGDNNLPQTLAYGSSAIAVVQAIRWRLDTYVVLGGPGGTPLIQPISATSFSRVVGNQVTIFSSGVWTYAPAENNPLLNDSNPNFFYFVVDVSGI